MKNNIFFEIDKKKYMGSNQKCFDYVKKNNKNEE